MDSKKQYTEFQKFFIFISFLMVSTDIYMLHYHKMLKYYDNQG